MNDMGGYASYVATYLGIGLLVLGAILLINKVVSYRRRITADEEDLTVFKPEPRYKKSRFRHWSEMAGLYLLAIILWPLIAAFALPDLVSQLRERKIAERDKDPQIRFYAKDNLIEIVTIEEAEVRERIHDPLGRVPPTPFGHLYDGWQKFLGRRPGPEAELWSFHRKTDNKDDWSIERANGTGRGYCWVVDNKVVAEIRVEGSY